MSFEFKRGLSDGFITELEKLAQKKSWFKDVLQDKDSKNRPNLIIALRGNYLNIYYNGQSLFKVDYKNKNLIVSTHPKYLLNPDISDQVFLNEDRFDIDTYETKNKGGILIKSYEEGTLKKLKRSANKYSGAEKTGVHDICRVNKNIIDVEITLTETDTSTPKKVAKRIDIAQFIEVDNKINLYFWEAKEYSNPELWTPSEKPHVIKQVKGYHQLVDDYSDQLKKSYALVAKNLVEIAKMSSPDAKVDSLIERVATGEDFVVTPKNIGVVFFGFSQSGKDSARHEVLLSNLQMAGVHVVAAGKAADIKLELKRK